MFTLYFTLAYLNKLFEKAQKGFSYFENDYDPNFIAFLDLIFGNESLIKIDSTFQEVENLSKENPFYKKLLKSKFGKLDFGVRMDDFNNVDTFIPVTDRLPIFFSDVSTAKNTKKNEERCGYYFNNSESILNRLFEVNSFNFSPEAKMDDWGFSNDFLLPMNTIIIVDPFLYKKDTLDSLEKLLMSIVSRNFKGTYHISLIGKSDVENYGNKLSKNDLIKIYKIFESNILNAYPELSISMEQLFVPETNKSFHDRYILTNNSMVFLSYGLDLMKFDNIKKDSTWLGFPPFFRMSLNGLKGAYLNTLKNQKLSILKKWVGARVSINPLLQ